MVATTGRLKQRLARFWLIKNDPEAADFWRAAPADWDFVEAVDCNISTFGEDETPMATRIEEL